jgi:hypothetical protein
LGRIIDVKMSRRLLKEISCPEGSLAEIVYKRESFWCSDVYWSRSTQVSLKEMLYFSSNVLIS